MLNIRAALIDSSIVMDGRLHAHPDAHQDDRGHRPDRQIQRVGKAVLDQSATGWEEVRE